MTEGPKLRIILVGGGLCGLATSIAVSLAGHEVIILEAHNGRHAFGAAVNSGPNGTSLYKKWGLDPMLEPYFTLPKMYGIRSAEGKVLAERPDYRGDVLNKYGFPHVTTSRVDLQAALTARAKELGADIRYNAKVVDINLEGPSIVLENGETHHGDMVIVCDGIWSQTRQLVLGEHATEPQPTGDMAYRIILDRDDVTDEAVAEWLGETKFQLWLGPKAHAVAYPMRGGKQVNIALLIPDSVSTGKTRETGDVDEMREIFKDWDPLLTKMLATVKKVEKWQLNHLQPPKRWRSPQNTTVLAGDSCHAILPYLGQGLNLSLEDAAVLGSLLGHVKSKDQIPKVAEIYERLRLSRAAKMLEMTLLRAAENHCEDPEVMRQRDEYLAQSDDPDWSYPKNRDWMWTYDAYAEAEAAYQADPF